MKHKRGESRAQKFRKMFTRKVQALPLCGGLILGLWSNGTVAQVRSADTLPPVKTASASLQYLPQLSSKALAGQRYRLEWAVPVKANVALLDTLAGGLRPDPDPKGPIPSALHLHDANGKAYTLKPLRQMPSRQMAPIYQGTIVADFADDLASALHPYAPLTIAPMAEAAGLQFLAPRLLFVPRQKALGNVPAWTDQLAYLQPLPAPADADTTTTWISTRRLLTLMEADNRNRPDTAAYLRLRLLDMLLGIATRSSDEWRWLAFPTGNGTTYLPFAESYEGAYPLYEGRLLSIAKILAPIGHLLPFERQFPDPTRLNERSLHLDRRLTSGLEEQDWLNAARQLRNALTDEVLQAAVRQMPMETQVLSGNEVFTKLRSRRNQLESLTQRYYDRLARKVDVLASAAAEEVRIDGEAGKGIRVRVFALDESGQPGTPLFERRFRPDETKEINLYGIGGSDRFFADGDIDKKINLRIIGGPGLDSLRNTTRTGNIQVYDNRANTFAYNRHSRYHLRNDAEVHRYDFDAFAFNKKGLRPLLFYNNNDRIFAGISYNYLRQGWRKVPFRQRHKTYLNYSLWQGGVSTGYEGTFNQIIGRWNGMISAEYDAIRWNNFFGIGNESPGQVLDNDFHRVRSEVVNADAGLFRPFGRYHSIGLFGRFQTVRIRPDTARFIGKQMQDDDARLYRTHQFAGGRITYSFQKLNDPLIPTRGLLINASSSYTQNLQQREREVWTHGGSLQFYAPVGKRLVWSSIGGLQAVTGQPEFYQLATIGGSATLRGFRRERFWGKTAAYNQNELMYLIPYRSYWFNGTLGLYGLFDAGRLWQPGEQSDRIHTGYGVGLMIVPFHRIRLELAYARSQERGMLHIGYRGSL